MTNSIECDHPLAQCDWHEGSFICMACGRYLHKEYNAPRLTEVMVFRLLCDLSDDELAYLELQTIRDAQEPRFKVLERTYPAIYRDFMVAKAIHDSLHRIGGTRINTLASIVTKASALVLLRDTYEEDCLHLELRIIRDAQAPRFEMIKAEHPENYADFIRARTGPHEVLLKNRRRRIVMLTAVIEGSRLDG